MPGGSNLPQPFRGTNLPAVRQESRQENPFERSGDGFSLEQYLQILARRKWLLVAVVLTAVAIGAFRVFTLTPLYEARATIQIDPGPQNVVPYQQFDLPGARFHEHLETQIQKLQSRRFMESLEARLGEPLPGTLVARRVGTTLLVGVSFTAPDPELAAEVVNTGVEQFMAQQVDSRLDATTQASGFLREQLLELQANVQQSEEAVLRYGREKGIVGLDDRESIARGRLDGLNEEVTRVDGEVFALRSTIDVVRRDPTAVPDDVKSAAVQHLETRLRELEAELETLSVRFGPAWPAIKETRDEIADVRELMRAEGALIVQGLERRLQAAQGQRARLVAEMGEQRLALDALNEDLIQHEILQRESELNKQLYQSLLQRLKEGNVAAGFQSSAVQLIEEARPPLYPSFPNKTKGLLQALVIGLVAALGAVVVVEALDNSIKTSEDVTQRLGLPSLGVVPLLDGKAPRRRRGRRRSRAHPTEDESPAMAFNGDGHHVSQEAYRSLRTSLLLSHSGNPPRSLLVTSALPREGKSTTAVNTAISLAQTGVRTVLMDLDLRRSTLDLTFDTSGEHGMTTYLSGNSDLSSQIRETRFPNLFLVPSGPPAPNPAELIHSLRLSGGLQLLSEYFGYIVIDSPPCAGLSDALLLSPRVDGVIVVARAGKTPRRAVVKAVEGLRSVGATVLGVLLNGVDLEREVYGYYGEYAVRYGSDGAGARKERRTA